MNHMNAAFEKTGLSQNRTSSHESIRQLNITVKGVYYSCIMQGSHKALVETTDAAKYIDNLSIKNVANCRIEHSKACICSVSEIAGVNLILLQQLAHRIPVQTKHL